MENESRFSQWFSRISERLADQPWFQQLRAKWDELDPQSRQYLRGGMIALGALLVFGTLLGSYWKVSSLKEELAEKQALLTLVRTTSDDVRRMKDLGGGLDAGGGPWSAYLESQIQGSGIDLTTATVSPEKATPESSGGKSTIEEALIDVRLNKVNLKQLVRLAHSLEQGLRPVKIRSLTIETEPDLSGWLKASLALSAFRTAEGN